MKKMVMIISVFILLGSIAVYFLLLQKIFLQYQIEKENSQSQLILLNQKKGLARKALKTEKATAVWKQKHPNFYAAMLINETSDQLLQLLTDSAQKSGLILIQATPVSGEQKSDYIIQLQLSGSYADLFYFINTINHAAWPITLMKLKMPKEGEIDCVVGEQM